MVYRIDTATKLRQSYIDTVYRCKKKTGGVADPVAAFVFLSVISTPWTSPA